MKQKDQIELAIQLGQAIGRKALGQQTLEQQEPALASWIGEAVANRQLIDNLHNEEFRQQELSEMNRISVAKGWHRLSKSQEFGIQSSRRRTILYSIAASITVLIALALGYRLFQPNHSNKGPASHVGFASAGIEPATSTATLSIASSEPIALGAKDDTIFLTASAKLAGKNGALILDRPTISEGAITNLVVQTPKGGTYFVKLSDGTSIWLNADSKLSFPDHFSGDRRQISITGEAYMEVASSASSPFIVHTPKGLIHVLGTAFNIKSYPEQHLEQTTLLSGKIEVKAAGKNKILRPAEMAITGNGSIEISAVDPQNSIAWKNSIFLFRNALISDVLAEIGRWYNLEIDYDPSFTEKASGFTARISRNERLDKVLAVLESSALASFKIQGRRLVILPGKYKAAENQP